MDEGYTVAAKPSARRVSVAVGKWVAESGRHRRFVSKAAAREWAREVEPDGRTLWVQDAHPLDEGPADGYLLARPSSLRGNEAELPGQQIGFAELRIE